GTVTPAVSLRATLPLVFTHEPPAERALRHHPRFDELQQVVWPACPRADTRAPMATKRVAAHARSGDRPGDLGVARAEPLGGMADARGRARVETASERVLGVVGERERVLEVIGTQHRQERAEDLLARDPRARIGRDDHHRSHVPTTGGLRLAPVDDLTLLR